LYISLPFGISCGRFGRFGMLYQEKSGNPELESEKEEKK
jgi:hypothetical protein